MMALDGTQAWLGLRGRLIDLSPLAMGKVKDFVVVIVSGEMGREMDFLMPDVSIWLEPGTDSFITNNNSDNNKNNKNTNSNNSRRH